MKINKLSEKDFEVEARKRGYFKSRYARKGMSKVMEIIKKNEWVDDSLLGKEFKIK